MPRGLRPGFRLEAMIRRASRRWLSRLFRLRGEVLTHRCDALLRPFGRHAARIMHARSRIDASMLRVYRFANAMTKIWLLAFWVTVPPCFTAANSLWDSAMLCW